MPTQVAVVVNSNEYNKETTCLFPTSTVPYGPVQWIQVEAVTPCRFGKQEVRLHNADGSLVEVIGSTNSFQEAVELVEATVKAHGTAKCNMVSGYGRWSVE